jgi:hypothetical protein
MADETTLNALSAVGTVTAVLQSASGFPLLRRIVQDRDSTKFSALPVFTMTGATVLIGQYAIYVVKRIDGLLICNAIGAVFWICNAVVFATFKKTQKQRLLFLALYLSLWAFCILLYLLLFTWLPEEQVPERATIVAVIMQIFNLSGFASPFRSLYWAVAELNTRRVPLALTYINVVNSSVWIPYGILLGDPWIWAPNVAGLMIALLQLLVLAWIIWRKRQLGITGDGTLSGSGGGKAGAAGGEADTSTAKVVPAPMETTESAEPVQQSHPSGQEAVSSTDVV